MWSLQYLAIVVVWVGSIEIIAGGGNPCELRNPCQNNGRCQWQEGKITCKCKSGYTGKHCKTQVTGSQFYPSTSFGIGCYTGYCRDYRKPVCIMEGLKPKCVENCRTKVCDRNEVCTTGRSGEGICIDPCLYVRCPEKCALNQFTRRAECQSAVPRECRQHKCQTGKVCTVVNNKPVCRDPPYNPCLYTRCPAGQYCYTDPRFNRPWCFDPCAATRCTPGTSCTVYQGRPFCQRDAPTTSPPTTTPPNPCHGHQCPLPGTRCVVRNYAAVCIDPCADVTCDSKTAGCRPQATGVGSCIELCDEMSCEDAAPVCIVQNNNPVCTNPCDNHACPPENPMCQVENKMPVCKNPCHMVDCPVDKPICKLENGNAVCKGVCDGVTCPYGHTCKNVNGKPVCSAPPIPPSPCANIICPLEQPNCVELPGGVAVCRGPCFLHLCIGGQTCVNKVVNGVAVASCEDYAVVSSASLCDTIKCKSPSASCTVQTLDDGSEGAVCNDPCASIACAPQTPICVIVTGKDGVAKAECQGPCQQMVCHPSTPECVEIEGKNGLWVAVCQNPCEDIVCMPGTQCVVQPNANGGFSTQCNPITPMNPCDGAKCEGGTICVAQNNQAACIMDPCIATTCIVGSQCIVNANGAAECRSNTPAPPSPSCPMGLLLVCMSLDDCQSNSDCSDGKICCSSNCPVKTCITPPDYGK